MTLIDRAIDEGTEPDDVLRTVVAALVDEPAVSWAGILFVDDGALTLGPEAGAPDPARRIGVPVRYEETIVGELAVDGEAETTFLTQVAERISTHVLLGWDTGGESWEP